MIVVVDDYEDAARVLTRLLGRIGLPSTYKTSGCDLLDFLRTNPTPELIILDVMMPLMSGLECLEAIRANPDWAAVPVVMYSADHTAAPKAEAERLGAQDYVAKGTVGWEQFLEVIRRYAGPHA